MCVPAPAYTCTYRHTCRHRQTYASPPPHTHIYAHTHAHTHTHTHTYTHMHPAQTHTTPHACTHTCTRARTHIYAHTHTQTHIWGVNLSVSCLFQKFMFFVLKSSDVLDILVPILYNLNDARADQCRFCVLVLWGYLCRPVVW